MTKLKLKFNSLAGFVDPISIIGGLFLLITLVVGTKVASDKGFSLNIIEQAKKAEKTGNAAFDKCREESGREVCNERLGTNVNWKGEIVEKIDTSKVDKNVTKPGDPTCDANGTQYSSGAVVVYGGIDSYATCGADGKWNVGVGTITQIKPENVPTYAKEKYDEAVEAEKQLNEQVAVPTTVTVEPEQIGLTQSTNQTSGTSVIPTVTPVTIAVPSTPKPVTSTSSSCGGCSVNETCVSIGYGYYGCQANSTLTQVTAAPVTAVTTPVSPFAGVTVGVTGKTIPQVQQTYTPPETYTPPLLTVPAFTAEDLLRKLPGLENLNINDFKELNYPTINKPDPAIITNKYGIVGAYANDPVRCKYGNGAIKEGDGKYACPTDTFANPILDNSQNISWYDQPLDIPALEFNLESTKPTVESEIKKLTDPLFNYILDYFSKYLPGISLP